MTRREMLTGTAGLVAGVTLARAPAGAAEPPPGGWKYSMCDWMLGRRANPSALDLAREIGLDGVQVSVGTPEDKLHLRRPDMQKTYLDLARKHGLVINSVAMGLLNDVPFASEPKTALWAADTIEVAKVLGARNILLAFFGNGHLKESNAEDMRRVTECLQELAPRAEKAQVVLGLETYLSAEAHLKILDQVRSKWVQVYYDVYNAANPEHAGYDYLKEIRLLGADRICEVHFKEGGKFLGEGVIKWPEVAATLKEVGYRGWITIEAGSPTRNVVADTRRNLAYLKKLFG
ncbi:MAG: sugar phosphate isomerase/epimerase [Phycisphaerae bacterium]|jgi:sugar phosphate isomerase/epimerase